MKSKKQIELEKKRLKAYTTKICKAQDKDEQEIDIDALYDSALSYNENKGKLMAHLKGLGWLKERKYIKEDIERLKAEQDKLLLEKIRELEKKEIEKLKSSKDTKVLDKIFWELNNKLDSFIKSERRLMIIIGNSGIGKSHTIFHRVSEITKQYEINRGVTTPAGLNDFLGAFSNGYIIILDDNEGWTGDKKAVSIIKAGSEKPYTVTWSSKDKRIEYKSWQNNSKWIVIMNEKPTLKLWKPIFSRSLLVNIELDHHEKIELIYEISKIKKIPMTIPRFIENNSNPSTDRLDIRTLEKGYEFYLTHPKRWRRLLLTELNKDPRKDFILQMRNEGIPISDMIAKFNEKGFGSRATFYNLSKNLIEI